MPMHASLGLHLGNLGCKTTTILSAARGWMDAQHRIYVELYDLSFLPALDLVRIRPSHRPALDLVILCRAEELMHTH